MSTAVAADKIVLTEKGYSLDLSNEKTLQKMMLPGDDGWHPGYFRRWFFNGLCCKEHDTYCTVDDQLGPICLSILQETDPNDDQMLLYRALVRSSSGFESILIRQSGKSHQRSLSLNRRINHLPKEVLLEQIMREYFDRLSLTEQVNIQQIIEQLVIAPYPSTAQKLLELERPFKTAQYFVDIVLSASLNDHEQHQQWKKFKDFLGEEIKASQSSSVKEELSDSIKTQSKKSSERRMHVLEEFIDKENRYLNKLQVIEEVFIEPLSQEKILSPQERKMAFPKISDLIQLHKRLVQDLQEGIVDQSTPIGAKILPHVDAFFIYKQFVNAHTNSVSKIKEFCQTNLAFKQFLKQAEKNPRCDKLSIFDLLIEPIQKLPRYILLLSELLNHTLQNDPDYQNLLLAKEKFKSLASEVNAAKHDEDAKVAMFQLLRSIEGCPNDLIKQNRKLLSSFDAHELDLHTQQPMKHMKLYLFNDSLMVVQLKKPKIHQAQKVIQRFQVLLPLDSLNLVTLKERGIEDGILLETIIVQDKRLIKLGNDVMQHEPKPEQNNESHWMMAFKLSELPEFLSQFWQSKEVTNPLQFPEEAQIYRRRLDDLNADFYFHIYDFESYKKQEITKNDLLLYYHLPEKQLKTADSDQAVTAGVIQPTGSQFRLIFKSRLQSRVEFDEDLEDFFKVTDEKNFLEKLFIIEKIMNRDKQQLKPTIKYHMADIVDQSCPRLLKTPSPFKQPTIPEKKGANLDRRDSKTSQLSSDTTLSQEDDDQLSNSPHGTLKSVQMTSKISRRLSMSKFLTPFSNQISRFTNSLAGKEEDYLELEMERLQLLCSYIEEQADTTPYLYQNGTAQKTKIKNLLKNLKSPHFNRQNLKSFEVQTAAAALYKWVKMNQQNFLPDSVLKSGLVNCSVEELQEVICHQLNIGQYKAFNILIGHLRQLKQHSQYHDILSHWSLLFLSEENSLSEIQSLLSTLVDNQEQIFTGCQSDEPIQARIRLPTTASMSFEKIPKQDLKHRNSLDSVMEKRQSRASLLPPAAYKKSLGSLDQIDEGFQSFTGSSILTTTTSDFETPKSERKKPARVPVPYTELELSQSAPSSPSVVRRASILPRLPKSIADNHQRRSVSLPVASKTIQDTFLKLVEANKKGFDIETKKMQTEIDNLRNQIKCLRKALEEEIKSKNEPKKNGIENKVEQIESFENLIVKMQSLYSSQIHQTNINYDAMSGQIDSFIQLFKEKEEENEILKKKLEEMYKEKESWKQQQELQ